MANTPFDRVVFNNAERPVSSDFNSAYSYIQQALMELLFRMTAVRTSATVWRSQDVVTQAADYAQFWGAGFMPRALGTTTSSTDVIGAGGGQRAQAYADIAATTTMSVTIGAGVGMWFSTSTASSIGGKPGVNDLAYFSPLYLDEDVTMEVPEADPVNPRWDVIALKLDRQVTDTSLRDIFDANISESYPRQVPKTVRYAGDSRVTFGPDDDPKYMLYYIKGSASGEATTPTPTIPDGYVAIAKILVSAGATSITNSDIYDARRISYINGYTTLALSCTWNTVATATTPYAVIDSFVGPPGVRVVLTSNLYEGLYKLGVYVFANDGIVAPAMIIPPSISSTASAFNVAMVDSNSSGSLSSAAQSVLADPANASPVLEAGLTEPVTATFFRLKTVLNGSAPSDGWVVSGSTGKFSVIIDLRATGGL